MNKNLLIAAAMAGLLGAGVAVPAIADEGKCYGIAKAGKNSCAAANGSHACAGQAKADGDASDWVSASAEECARQGGKTTAPSAK